MIIFIYCLTKTLSIMPTPPDMPPKDDGNKPKKKPQAAKPKPKSKVKPKPGANINPG
jgi:hypothetical protein